MPEIPTEEQEEVPIEDGSYVIKLKQIRSLIGTLSIDNISAQDASNLLNIIEKL